MPAPRKLTEDQVRAIRTGEVMPTLAAKLWGMNRSALDKVRAGLTYKEVKCAPQS